jgi:hypothetical protein
VYCFCSIDTNVYLFAYKSAIDAALAVKKYLDEGMTEWHIAILVSLDVKGAFDAAWWSSILKTLKELNCPKNVYNLAKSYFNERTATLSTNTGCPTTYQTRYFFNLLALEIYI